MPVVVVLSLDLAPALERVGSCLHERCGETDSFTALALHSFNHSVTQVTDGPPFICRLPRQCHDWFSFLNRACVCEGASVRVCAKVDERKFKGDGKKPTQPGRCTKTESRREMKRTERLKEMMKSTAGVFSRVSRCGQFFSGVYPPPLHMFFMLRNTNRHVNHDISL